MKRNLCGGKVTARNETCVFKAVRQAEAVELGEMADPQAESPGKRVKIKSADNTHSLWLETESGM